MSNVIFVSGNIKKPKAIRGKPRKSASGSKSQKTTASRSRSRSVASSSAHSDGEEDGFTAQKDIKDYENDQGMEDYDLMEEESVHFAGSNSEEEEEGNEEDSSAHEAVSTEPKAKVKKSKTRKATGPPPLGTFIQQTAFDVYFAYTSSKLQVSNNVLSSLVEPLTHEEVHNLEQRMKTRAKTDKNLQRLQTVHESYFPNYWFELHNGFNILFHGYGSKRAILTTFGKMYCAKNGHVVIVNGYNKRASLKAILTSIEQISDIGETSVRSSGWEGQLQRIYDFFRDSKNPPLYLLIHTVESPSLRDHKTSILLSTLALHPRIHIVASADHINVSLLWSSAEISARKHEPSSIGSEIPSHKGYAWLFHDLTTFSPYFNEIASRDVTALPSQNQGSNATAGAGQALTEPAMSHILASVTEKAKRLFRLLSTKQMAAVEEDASGKVAGLEKYGMQYDLLFNEARKEFLATSDVALRALLGEFMDHGMVLSGGTPEVLWIPAGKEVLKRVLQNIENSS